ncbi:MAG: ABC transporter permease [Sandaracinaceae bacterium]|nr:ABC transporter permease [Sandaracinaceae bacterium]
MASGGIDLSIGSVIALVSVATAILLRDGASPGLALLGGLAVGTAVGLLNGLLVTRLSIVPFIVTLGTMGIARGAAKYLADEQTVNAPAGWLADLMTKTPEPRWLLVSRGVWITLALAALGAFVLRRTVFGVHTLAIGSSEATARLAGVRVERVKLAIYAIAGLFAGIAGVMQLGRLTVGDPTTAIGLELDVIAAVVLGGASLSGGRGSIAGSLLGAFFMSVLANGCTLTGVPTYVQGDPRRRDHRGRRRARSAPRALTRRGRWAEDPRRELSGMWLARAGRRLRACGAPPGAGAAGADTRTVFVMAGPRPEDYPQLQNAFVAWKQRDFGRMIGQCMAAVGLDAPTVHKLPRGHGWIFVEDSAVVFVVFDREREELSVESPPRARASPEASAADARAPRDQRARARVVALLPARGPSGAPLRRSPREPLATQGRLRPARGGRLRQRPRRPPRHRLRRVDDRAGGAAEPRGLRLPRRAAGPPAGAGARRREPTLARGARSGGGRAAPDRAGRGRSLKSEPRREPRGRAGAARGPRGVTAIVGRAMEVDTELRFRNVSLHLRVLSMRAAVYRAYDRFRDAAPEVVAALVEAAAPVLVEVPAPRRSLLGIGSGGDEVASGAAMAMAIVFASVAKSRGQVRPKRRVEVTPLAHASEAKQLLRAVLEQLDAAPRSDALRYGVLLGALAELRARAPLPDVLAERIGKAMEDSEALGETADAIDYLDRTVRRMAS